MYSLKYPNTGPSLIQNKFEKLVKYDMSSAVFVPSQHTRKTAPKIVTAAEISSTHSSSAAKIAFAKALIYSAQRDLDAAKLCLELATLTRAVQQQSSSNNNNNNTKKTAPQKKYDGDDDYNNKTTTDTVVRLVEVQSCDFLACFGHVQHPCDFCTRTTVVVLAVLSCPCGNITTVCIDCFLNSDLVFFSREQDPAATENTASTTLNSEFSEEKLLVNRNSICCSYLMDRFRRTGQKNLSLEDLRGTDVEVALGQIYAAQAFFKNRRRANNSAQHYQQKKPPHHPNGLPIYNNAKQQRV